MAILKSEKGLIQLERCPKCGYHIMQHNMIYKDEKPVICTFCDEDRKLRDTPIGIMPERIWKARRIGGLQEAISRYILAGNYREVVREWCRELEGLLESSEKDASPTP